MRRFLLAAMMFGTVSGARAADLSDLPILRGSFPEGLSTATRNWDDWYAGGQIDYSSAPLYSTRHRKCKESNGLTGSFGDRSWARKAII
jgi:hypothetical protein